MDALGDLLDWTFGLSADSVNVGQVLARCVTFYVLGLAMVRLGDKRFLGKHTAFDVVLAVMLGSLVSRAITDGVSAGGMLVAGFALVIIHLVISKAAFRSDRFGTLVKGRPRVLVRDGEIDWGQMSKAAITRDDLLGLMRVEAGTDDPGEVAVAHLERSGDVSFITRSEGPHVIDVRVEAGVQVVSIRLC